MAKSSKELVKDLLQQNKLSATLKAKFDAMAKAIEEGGNALAEWDKLFQKIVVEIDSISKSADFIQQSFEDTLNETRKTIGAISRQRKALKGIQSIAENVLQLRIGEGDASIKTLKTDLEKVKQQRTSLQIAAADKDITEAKRKEIEAQLKQTDNFIGKLKTALKVSEQTKNELGFTGEILSGFDKLLQKAGFSGLGIEDAVEQTQKLAQVAQATGDKEFGAMGTFTGLVKDNLLAALSPMKILELLAGAVLKVFIGMDESTGKLAKQLGTSYSEAKKIKTEFSTIAKDSNNIFVTTKSLTHSFEVLADRFGVIGGFSEETLKTQTELVKQAGYSEETASEIAKLSLLTGESSKEIAVSALGTAKAFNMQNGLLLNEKALLEEASQLSSDIQLSLGNSTAELVKAVATAKKFGLSLEQVDNIAESLLDFEGSIASELEAELLLGKNINLEKARQYALDNNLAGVAEEIANQVGTAAEFSKMNRIQQDAIAKSVGMTKGDLAKSLQEREALVALGGDAATSQEAYNKLLAEGLTHEQIAKKLGNEKLASSLKANSVQERFAQSLEKAQELFVNIVTTIQPFINALATGVGYLAAFVSKFQVILKIATAIYALDKLTTASTIVRAAWQAKINLAKEYELGTAGKIFTLLGFENAAIAYKLAMKEKENVFSAIGAALEETKVGAIIAQGIGMVQNLGKLLIENAARMVGMTTALATNSFATFGIGVAVALAAAAAGIMAVKSLTKADDLMSPGGGKGYGDRILTSPEGSFALNNKDTVVAGTNLGGGSSKTDALLETLVRQNSKKPQISPVGLYSVQ